MATALTAWARPAELVSVRSFIVVAFAVLVMAGVFMRGADVPAFEDDPVVIGAVTKGGAADRARGGDRLRPAWTARTALSA